MILSGLMSRTPTIRPSLDIIPEPSDDEAETTQPSTPENAPSRRHVVLEESPEVSTSPLIGLDSARCIAEHLCVHGVSEKKTCRLIFVYNSRVSWSIFKRNIFYCWKQE